MTLTRAQHAALMRCLDAALALHTKLRPNVAGFLRHKYCQLCAKSAGEPERFPCRTRRRLLAARRLLTPKAKAKK